MPITVTDPIVFSNSAAWDFDVDDNDYSATLSANGYTSVGAGPAAWAALTIQCEVFTPPAHGTLVQIKGPSKGSLCDWTYTSDSSWTGSDTMTYKIAYTNLSMVRVKTAPETVTFLGPTGGSPPNHQHDQHDQHDDANQHDHANQHNDDTGNEAGGVTSDGSAEVCSAVTGTPARNATR